MPYRILSKGKNSGQVNFLATTIDKEEDVVTLVTEFNERHGEILRFWYQDVKKRIPAKAVEIAAKSYGRATPYEPVWDEEE
jgi:hypothetical protein